MVSLLTGLFQCLEFTVWQLQNNVGSQFSKINLVDCNEFAMRESVESGVGYVRIEGCSLLPPSWCLLVHLMCGVSAYIKIIIDKAGRPFVIVVWNCWWERICLRQEQQLQRFHRMALAPPLPSAPSQHNRYSKFAPTGGDSMSSSPISSTSPLASPQTSPRPEVVPQVPPQQQALLSVAFNQDHGCFSCGTQTGFRIYNCDPFKETFRREFDGAGIAIVEMLFRCNILALVGGGKAPRYSPNKVMIWDDHQSRCIGELSFRSEVRAVRLRRDKIVVVLEFKIYVYNFADLKLLHQIETLANTRGLCALSPGPTSCVLACPGQRRGEVRVELYSVKKTRFVQAHDSSLACMALCLNGALLATASTKGTLIRIFSTVDGSKLQEVKAYLNHL